MSFTFFPSSSSFFFSPPPSSSFFHLKANIVSFRCTLSPGGSVFPVLRISNLRHNVCLLFWHSLKSIQTAPGESKVVLLGAESDLSIYAYIITFVNICLHYYNCQYMPTLLLLFFSPVFDAYMILSVCCCFSVGSESSLSLFMGVLSESGCHVQSG